MDTSSLVVWVMGVIMIAIGLPLFYIASYLSAPEDKKQQRAGYLKVIAVIWVAAGVLIYISVLVGRFIVK
ncbi:MAG: hypothetical protein ABSG90_05680 [Dehalococcoidia bacterium]|jgi:uncharacterized membrane-anchored protein